MTITITLLTEKRKSYHTGSGGDVVIPDTLGGVSISKILDKAFYNMPAITSIVIPEGVTSIGKSAFQCIQNPGRSQLASATLPSTLTSIGDYAFGYCQALLNLVIPDSDTNIGAYAFSQCQKLQSLTHSANSNLTTIGDDVFSSCGLQSLTLPDSVTSMGKGLTQVNLAPGTTEIGDFAFLNTYALKTVDLPAGVSKKAHQRDNLSGCSQRAWTGSGKGCIRSH